MRSAADPIDISPDSFFDDGALVLLLGITHATLSQARKRKKLRFTRRGRKILYRGSWVLEWLESDRPAETVEGGRR